MEVQIKIDVESEKQAKAIQAAMNDPETRAFAIIVGTLLSKNPRTCSRILTYVEDLLTEGK
jgi:hypothetical protein